ncbi:MAG: hypothetical protein GY950_23490 [bacterium]|nr:hypothetical protein [bacterium]
MQWHDSDKILGRPIGKSLLSLAVPAVISTFFIFVFEIIDMFLNFTGQAKLPVIRLPKLPLPK